MKKLMFILIACLAVLAVKAQSHVVLQMTDGTELKMPWSTFRGLQFLDKTSVAKPSSEVKPTIRQYLESIKDRNQFAADICSGDYMFFYPKGSRIDMPDSEGRLQYVDSVFCHMNYYRDGFVCGFPSVLGDEKRNLAFGQPHSMRETYSLYLDMADTAFAVIIPSNEAYAQAIEAAKDRLRYASAYASLDGLTGSTNYTWKSVYSADSLSNLMARAWVMNNYIFPMAVQPNAKVGASCEALIDAFHAAKGKNSKWVTARGDTLPCQPNFGVKMPLRRTNGLVYETNVFDEVLLTPLMKDYKVKCGWGNICFQNNYNNYKLGSGSRVVMFNPGILPQTWAAVDGSFMHLVGQSYTANPKVSFALPPVPSGKYELQIVTVPTFYERFLDAGGIDPAFFDEEGNLIEEMITNLAQLYKFKVSVYYASEAGKMTSTKAVTVTSSGEKVDTISIAINSQPDFDLPFSYQGIPSFPYITIEGAVTTSDMKKGYSYQICLDAIILRAKRE